MAERIEMPRWGWGNPDHERHLPEDARVALSQRLGISEAGIAPAGDDDFKQVATALSESQIDALSRAAGGDAVTVEFNDRLVRSAGKSYPDLVRMWTGEQEVMPDAVVTPGDDETVGRVLGVCAAEGIAVVPFGGGTSVVGGVEALRGENAAAICLDLRKLDGLVELDTQSRIARLRAGTLGPASEKLLNPHGLTIGHFPQSFEFATIGGFAATRSAGQASTGYGRFDRNVLGLKLVAPSCEIDLPAMPGTAAGPNLREVVVGSEGVLGVITDVTLQLAAIPDVIEDRAWFFESFEAGREALRELEQAGVAPDVSRLSDENETEISLLMSGAGLAGRALSRYLALRGVAGGSLMIGGFEGTSADVRHRLNATNAILRKHGAVSLGAKIGRAWRKGRYNGPYLRDVLMARGLMVDTLETATVWSNLESLYRSVKETLVRELGALGGEPIVMCHISHLYPGGASLYFTWIGRQPGSDAQEQIANWHRVKHAAGNAINSNGGTITHHHAIGVDHAEWLGLEVGQSGVDLLRAVKSQLDPAGVMNPGKLI